MLKRSITFKDLEKKDITQDFYFNLSTKELVEMELSGEDNSFMDEIQRIVNANKGATIIDTFQKIILRSYGERDVDGIKFNKIDDVTGAPLYYRFMNHPAYDVLFVELCTDADAGALFINGVMPDDIAEQMAKVKNQEDGSAKTKDELLAMSDEEFVAEVGDDPKKMTPDQLMVAYQRRNAS